MNWLMKLIKFLEENAAEFIKNYAKKVRINAIGLLISRNSLLPSFTLRIVNSLPLPVFLDYFQ